MAVEVVIRNSRSDRLEALRVGESLHLRGLSWEDYIEITNEIGERRLLTYYLEGEMEIVWAHSPLHPWICLIDRFICSLSDELNVPRRSIGMSTLRRNDLEIAIEPCRAFYFTNEAALRGRFELDLSVIPPPDLVIEVDVGQNVEKRMSVYAQLGVPEVWRFDGDNLTVTRLVENAEYIPDARSQYLPQFPIGDFVRFGRICLQTDDTSLAVLFPKWIREQIATGWPVKTNAESSAIVSM